MSVFAGSLSLKRRQGAFAALVYDAAHPTGKIPCFTTAVTHDDEAVRQYKGFRRKIKGNAGLIFHKLFARYSYPAVL